MDSNTLSQDSALKEFESIMKELNTREFPFTVVDCDSTQPDYNSGGLNGEAVKLEESTNVIEIESLPGGDDISNKLIPANDITRSPTGTLPSTEDYAGPYNFKIKLSSSNRCAWAFSEKLNKVFIDMNKVMLLQFSITPNNEYIPLGLIVRALLMYTSPDNLAYPVKRCFLHSKPADPKSEAHAKDDICRCKEFNFVGHVLTTDHDKAYYDFNELSQRHSVTVPLEPNQPEYGDTLVAYQFGCKTSCQSGMARRPARIIFTLETRNGDVIGRNSLLFKVCSCPKRDKGREEEDYLKEKQHSTRPNSVKRKSSNFPNDQAINQENYVTGSPVGKRIKFINGESYLERQRPLNQRQEPDHVMMTQPQPLPLPQEYQNNYYCCEEQLQVPNRDKNQSEICDRCGINSAMVFNLQHQIDELNLKVDRNHAASERIEEKLTKLFALNELFLNALQN